MTGMQVISQYHHLPSKIMLGIMLMLFPVWGIIAPLISFFLLLLLLLKPGDFLMMQFFASIQGALLAVLGIAIFSAGSFLLTCFFAQIRISTSRDGICFPGSLRLLAGFPSCLAWSDIDSILISRHQELVLNKNHKSFRLNMNCLNSAEREKFLLSVALWADTLSKTDSLRQYLSKASEDSCELPNFTQIWKAELRRHFCTTSFVPLEPGTTIQQGKLRILRQLSFAGLQAVYLCQKDQLQLFVLKELVLPYPSVESHNKLLELFCREAKILSKLSHANVVKVFDNFVEDKRQYLLLEYVHGSTLRQLIKERGVMNESESLHIGLVLCQVLEYLHSQVPAIIHRDLGPDNLVCGADGQVVVIDFGAALELLGKITGTIIGKECYMAPEQFQGRATLQSDIYSLGATLFFLLTGSDPEAFTQSSPAKVKSGIRASVDSLVQQCTALKLDDRFENIGKVKDAISGMLA